MNLDRRCTAALRRIFATIDERCARELVATAVQAERAMRDLDSIWIWHRRSAGQRRRFAEVRRQKGMQ